MINNIGMTFKGNKMFKSKFMAGGGRPPPPASPLRAPKDPTKPVKK